MNLLLITLLIYPFKRSLSFFSHCGKPHPRTQQESFLYAEVAQAMSDLINWMGKKTDIDVQLEQMGWGGSSCSQLQRKGRETPIMSHYRVGIASHSGDGGSVIHSIMQATAPQVAS